MIDAFVTSESDNITGSNVEFLIQAMSEYCSTNGITWTNELSKSNEDVQEILTQYYSS